MTVAWWNFLVLLFSVHFPRVSVLFKQNLNITIFNQHQTIDGRRIWINVSYPFFNNDTILTIFNIYASNQEKQRIEYLKKLLIIF